MLFDFRTIVLPYCLEQQADGSWVALNREYKPVGFFTDEYIDYAMYPVRLKVGSLTRRIRSRLDCLQRVSGNCIYLYNDGCVPTASPAHMRAYLKRIELLSHLSCE